MDKTLVTLVTVLFLIVGSLVGGLVGYNMGDEKVKEVEVIKEVEIPGKNITIEVPVVPDYLSEAEDFFLGEVEDEDRLLVCDGHEYDFEDVEVSRIYDEYSYTFDDEDLTVDFKVKLTYDEEDSRSCKKTFEPSVYFEDYFTDNPEEPKLSL